MGAISADEIISILREEIENYDTVSRDKETGTVVSVGDGIASIYGIDHAMYGEIVTLETGLKGMVQDIRQNEISCILFGDDSDIKEGTKAARTGKRAGIPVGEKYIGRIVDALGAPIDGLGGIEADGYRPVEQEAPGIVERKSVSVPLQYIVPYSATALAEYFMYQGRDVLIVYDDLSKHAVAYRAISLLLGRSPGREAYPGDVFYLHSRLLERSSRLNEKAGGGSITALPIIETQAGDVSAYIPTNVISITDGQIFLESDLFNAGMRPAVNVGLSVSRVGGAAQTKAMKKASGSVRIDLAQSREMESFTQFSSDLDEATKMQLKYGACLTELLKQPLCRPLSLHEQVITLCAATHKVLLDVDTKDIKEFQTGMLDYIGKTYPEIGKEIEERQTLDDALTDKILKAVGEYKENR